MTLKVACPYCGFFREVAAGKIPEGRRQVTCPSCRKVFFYEKPGTEHPETVQPPQEAPIPPQRPEPPPRTGTPASRPVSPGRPPWQTPSPVKGLTAIGQLFDESLRLYRQRFLPLFPLYLLSIIAAVCPIAASILPAVIFSQQPGWLLGLQVVIGVICGSLLGVWFFASFLHALLDEALSFRNAVAKGKKIILPLFWVSLLSGLIVAGGYFLLLIPGIIFTVWFLFSSFVLVAEEVSGTGALLKSREYVRDFWWGVALRSLLVCLVGGVLGVIPLIGPVLSLLYFPYMMIFLSLVFRDLRREKGDVPYSCGMVDRLRWPAVGLAGFILIPVLLLSLGGMAFFANLPNVKGLQLLPAAGSGKSDGNYRVITFPAKDQVGTLPDGGASSGESPGPETGLAGTTPAGGPAELDPYSFHVFVYSVNYTGTVRINGKSIREIPGQPDMQYNFNGFGEGLQSGGNQVEVEYAEVTGSGANLSPEMHIKISRSNQGSGSTVLGDWRMSDRGSGSRTFDLEIPQN